MAEQNDADKTEPATPKRKGDARKKGEVAKSKELSATILMAVAFLTVASAVGAAVAVELMTQARALLGGNAILPDGLGDYHAVLLHSMGRTALVLAPVGLLLVLAAIAVNVGQVGLLFSWEAMAFKANRMSPLAGFKRMLGPDQAFELGKAMLKVLIIGGLATAVLAPGVAQVVGLAGAGTVDGLVVAGNLSRQLVIVCLLALLLLAMGDLAWVRYRYERKLRMTKQEVRDELKQREGDPKLRGKMRSQQLEMSRHRMLAAVAEANVVITNPTHFAVALRYDRSAMVAPTVVAKGRNHLAEKIRAEARKHLIPVVENPPLARALHRDVRVGREIPEALFHAVAEVLAYVYRLDPSRAWSRSAA